MSEWSTVLINVVTVIPPTIAALAAFRSAQKARDSIGETNGTSLAMHSQDSTSAIILATTILDRMDERLGTVEKTVKKSMQWHDDHEEWHAKGMPERRKSR